jgi:regulator of sigma E protease
MFDNLLTILNFIIVLALLIAVHEFGHFWVARINGVKVLRFSIGFGRPLFSWYRKGDPTEYVIAAIPLGGYVKMADEREGKVEEADLPKAFNRQSLAVRTAIVAAGPVFNLVFALFVFWLMFINGVPGVKPLVGSVVPNTPAAIAGIHPGDEIVQVGDIDTPSWQAVMEYLVPRALLDDSVKITLKNDQAVERQLSIDFSSADLDLSSEEGAGNFFSRWGVEPFKQIIPAVLDEITVGSAAEFAGLQHGDRVVEVDGIPIDDWLALVKIIKENPGKPLLFVIDRKDQVLQIEVRPETIAQQEKQPFGRIGASVYVDPERYREHQVMWQFSPVGAVGAAFEKSVDISWLTLKMIGQMITGKADVDNLSGPITIARYARASADAGLSQLLGFVAVISISLGILNLLPIPVLDGGHLFFYLIEAIKGSPVSEQIEMMGQRLGIAIILMMMSIALFNDILRLV